MTDFPHPDDRHEEFRLPGVPELRLPDDSWERRLDDWREMMLVRPQGIFGRGELSFRRFIKKKEEVQTG